MGGLNELEKGLTIAVERGTGSLIGMDRNIPKQHWGSSWTWSWQILSEVKSLHGFRIFFFSWKGRQHWDFFTWVWQKIEEASKLFEGNAIAWLKWLTVGSRLSRQGDDWMGAERSGAYRRVKGLEVGVRLSIWCNASKRVGQLEGKRHCSQKGRFYI